MNNWLLFREIFITYCENLTIRMSIFSGRKADSWYKEYFQKGYLKGKNMLTVYCPVFVKQYLDKYIIRNQVIR